MTSSAPGSRRLRVMQCITRLGLGGAERVAFSIMQGLGGQVSFGVFTVHDSDAHSISDAMRAQLRAAKIPLFTGTRLPMKRGGMLPGAFALARAVWQFQPDVIHFHSETPEACGAMMAQLFPCAMDSSVVRTIHNSIFWRYWPRIGRWCDRRLSRAYIACVSEGAADEFLRYRQASGAGPPPAPPVVIYNGVSIPRRPPHSAPHEPSQRRVLFAGRFEYQKGTDVLCDALPYVQLPAETAGRLTFIGHGTDEPRLRALAASPPAKWAVDVRDPVAVLEEVLPDFDILAMPSRFEGLGLVAIEATLCGLPVVTTTATGLRETLPANYPWRAKPGDAPSLATALGQALQETSRWSAAVDAAQQFAHVQFSPAAMTDAYLRLYARAGRSA